MPLPSFDAPIDPPLQLEGQDIARLAEGLRIIALRVLGDADEAQEVAQESLARALDAISRGKLRDRARLGAFVRGIARHVIVDELRRRSRHTDLSGELPDPHLRGDALDSLVAHEDVRALRAALGELSETDRNIIRLAFVDGRSPAEIAAALREPAERVRKRKSRALERLRQVFLGRRQEGGHVAGSSPTIGGANRPRARAADAHD